MNLNGPTFHVTPVDLCIIFQCNLYISCIMSCGNKIGSNCFKIVSNCYVLSVADYSRGAYYWGHSFAKQHIDDRILYCL